MIRLIQLLSDAYIFAIVARVLLSWIRHNPDNPIIRFLYQITDLPLAVIRKYVPTLGGLDISPMILIFAIIILEKIIIRILIF